MRLLFACLLFAFGLSAQAAPALERLREAMATVRFIAYSPSRYEERDGAIRPVSVAELRADLQRLRPDFDGLITYASKDGLEAIAAVAHELGFKALIVGVWEPRAEAELEAALMQARRHPELVLGLALGNEGLISRRYDWPALAHAFARARAAAPALPLATSEPFAIYLDAPPNGFLAAQDFLLPNVHPLFEPWFAQAPLEAGADFVGRVVERLQQAAGKPVLVKETGVPSGPVGSPYSPERQTAFWVAMHQRLPRSREHAVAAFEAFDQPWKPAVLAAQFKGPAQPEEAYWGFYDAAGRPKPVVERLRALRAGQYSAPP